MQTGDHFTQAGNHFIQVGSHFIQVGNHFIQTMTNFTQGGNHIFRLELFRRKNSLLQGGGEVCM
jgi:hypothetical protein